MKLVELIPIIGALLMERRYNKELEALRKKNADLSSEASAVRAMNAELKNELAKKKMLEEVLHRDVRVAVEKREALEQQLNDLDKKYNLLLDKYELVSAEKQKLDAIIEEHLKLTTEEENIALLLKKYSDASKTLAIIACRFDNDTVVYLNGSAERILGINSKEVVGRKLDELFRKKEIVPRIEEFRAYIKGTGTRNLGRAKFELRKDKKVIDVEFYRAVANIREYWIAAIAETGECLKKGEEKIISVNAPEQIDELFVKEKLFPAFDDLASELVNAKKAVIEINLEKTQFIDEQALDYFKKVCNQYNAEKKVNEPVEIVRFANVNDVLYGTLRQFANIPEHLIKPKSKE